MKLLVWQKRERSKILFNMKFYEMMDHVNLRFFVNKTIKYGRLMKLRYKKEYTDCYYSDFVYGFSVYVLCEDPISRYNEDLIKAVILERNAAKDW